MSETPARRRLATVGAGYFSQFHYDAWRRLDVDMVGVCSLALDEAEAVASSFGGCLAFDDFETILDAVTPDLVDIIAPPVRHMDFIRAAVDRGVAIICQKPFTRSLNEAEAAVTLAEKAGVRLFVHENFRFQPWHMKIKEMLDGGRLGEMWVEGSQGTIRLSGDGGVFFRAFGSNDEQPVPFDWEARGFAGDSVYRTQKQILSHLATDAPVANTARDYLANLRVEEAVYRSSETGRRISLS